MNMRVGVITSTYCRPKLLRRAVDCVYAQTYRDFEHVIVQDFGNTPPVESGN